MFGELTGAVGAEALKVSRSWMPWATFAAITLAGLMGALFMFILQDASRAEGLGLLGSKAQIMGGTADWPGYFALTAQTVSVGGLLIFGMITIWLFGREFADRTARDLMALPTSRTSIVLAKLGVALVWCLVLLAVLVAFALAFGALLDLPGWSVAGAVQGLGLVLLTGGSTIGLATTYGLVASVARGYLTAVGAMFLTVFLAQVIVALGFGAVFPWAVPALMAGSAGPAQIPGVFALASVVLVTLASIAATLLWWQRADHA